MQIFRAPYPIRDYLTDMKIVFRKCSKNVTLYDRYLWRIAIIINYE